MKTLITRTFFLVLFASLLSFNSHSQSIQNPTPEVKVWISYNAGVVSNTIEDFRLRGGSHGLELSISKGMHLFTLRGEYASTKKKISGGYNFGDAFFTSLLGGTYIPSPEKYIKSSTTAIDLMYGIISKPKGTRIYASTGLSYVMGSVDGSYSNSSQVGIPLEAGILFNTKHVGIGLGYIANFNKFSSYQGVSMKFLIGELK